MAESYGDLRERLQASGEWDAYLRVKQAYSDAGYKVRCSKTRAGAHFPYDGSGDRGVGIIDGSVKIQRGGSSDATEVAVDRVKPGSVGVGVRPSVSGVVSVPAVTSKMPEPRGAAIELSSLGEMDLGNDLRRDMYWVYQHMDVRGLTAEMAPSPGAWSQLWDVRSSAEARNEFRRSMAKLLPSRSDLDGMDGREDDGRRAIELIRAILSRD